MTKISQLTPIGANLAADDEFIIRDVSDASNPNKRVTSSGFVDYIIAQGTGAGFTQIAAGVGPLARALATSSGATGTLVFSTASATTLVERMRITSNGSLGVGTSSPAQRFHVSGGSILVDGALSSLQTSAAAIDFSSGDARFISMGANASTSGGFRFLTSTTTTPTTPFVITPAGNIAIGDLSPTTDGLSLTNNYSIGFNANSTGNVSRLRWRFSGTEQAWIERVHADGALAFGNQGTERARIDSSGRLLVGTATANTSGAKLQTSDGLTFPATAVASADPNTLDDYEEGTWTPGQGTGVTVVGTFSSVGRYTKIGRVVFYEGYMSAVTSVAFNPVGGNLTTGLPFTVVAGSGSNGNAVNNSASVLILLYAGGTVVGGSASIPATTVIYFSGQYIV